MAASINGLAGQQIPLSNTFKPGENQPKPQDVGAPKESGKPVSTAPTKPESSSPRPLQEQQMAAKNTDRPQEAKDTPRGSVIDIQV